MRTTSIAPSSGIPVKDDVFVDLEAVHLLPEFLVFPAEQHGIACQLAAGGDQ